MIKRLVLPLLLLAAGCATKKPQVEAVNPTDTATQEAAVRNQDINLDAQGSDSGKIVGLHTINFEFDKSALTASARETLAENAKWIQGQPANIGVSVEGHCDERGSNEYNLALGERRAKAVKAYLVSLGVPANRLSTISYGEERPLRNEHSEEAWAVNRRANFVPVPNMHSLSSN